MRVGVNTLFLIPSEVGGSETILIETLREFAAQFPAIEICCFTNQENDLILRSCFKPYPQIGFELLNFSASNRHVRIFREQFELPGRVRRAHIDLLWSPGYTAPLNLSIPQVVSILDLQYKSHPEDFTWIARLATQILVPLAAKKANHIVTLSQFSKSEIVRYLKINDQKISVVSCAANSEFSNVSPRRERENVVSKMMPLGLPYLLCVANSYPHKNLTLLAEAFDLLSSEIPHRLVIAGRPALGEKELESVISRIPKGRVIRLNYVNRPELIPLYQGADIFILPSFYEGFGLPILEAMMASVPVITTKCASIPEVGGDAVFYFDSKDKHDLAKQIKKVLSLSAGERNQVCGKAKARALQFSWKRAGEDLGACFKKAQTFLR